MARVGEEFPLACPTCGGDIRLITFITDPVPIRKIVFGQRLAERSIRGDARPRPEPVPGEPPMLGICFWG